MLRVNLIDPNGNIAQLLESRILSGWGRPIHFKSQHVDASHVTADLSSELMLNVSGSSARWLDDIANIVCSTEPCAPDYTFAAARYSSWKAAGFPGADAGIVPFLESIVATGYYWPVWSCIGHVEPDTSTNGHVAITGSYSQLLMLEKQIYAQYEKGDTDLNTIVLEMTRLIHLPNDDWSEVIMHPTLTLRWWGRTDEELQRGFNRTRSLLLRAAHETIPSIIARL